MNKKTGLRRLLPLGLNSLSFMSARLQGKRLLITSKKAANVTPIHRQVYHSNLNNFHMMKITNVVLVHGAFADGSGFSALYSELKKKKLNVRIVRLPLTSLEKDALATKLVLDSLENYTVLVGHSWGGAVITAAGNHPKVAGLIYLAGFQPDDGESALQWYQTVTPAPENGVLPPDENGIINYDKSKFHAGFCADVDSNNAEFMWATHGAFYAKAFATAITDAAWKYKPAFGVVTTEDKTIDPIIQHNMYRRSRTPVIEMEGSHAIYMSQAEKVADFISTVTGTLNREAFDSSDAVLTT